MSDPQVEFTMKTPPKSRPSSPPLVHPESARSGDPESPHTLLVASLRAQVSDLISQVNQLNGKLIQSYDRVSDLEDTVHVTSSNLRQTTLQVSQLEIERSQHLSALNTGLLVEKETITNELSRLMVRVAEETAQRGLAESAKADIEKDLDDLSANLFSQANTMVAEARYARAMSERKAEEAEQALHGTEEAVSVMQQQMQQLREEKERSEQELEQARQLMGKGKWVARQSLSPDPKLLFPRLMTTTVAYQEFLVFISHLRSLRSSAEVPTITSLLSLAFLARLVIEDSDPTLRLDLAPSLNWLTRRSVQTAIQTGQLTIEPVSSQRLHLEPTLATSISSPSSLHELTCALCGKYVFSTPNSTSRLASPRLTHQASASWATTSRFLKSSLTLPLTQPPSPSHDVEPSFDASVPLQTFIFRIALPPSTPTGPQHQKASTMYPLCHDGFCLTRLRSTCELWHFVRSGLVDAVWNEPREAVLPPPLHPRSRNSYQDKSTSTSPTTSSKPSTSPIVPAGTTLESPSLSSRKVSTITVASRVGTLWGKGLGALGLNESSSETRTVSRPESPALPPAPVPRRLPPLPTGIGMVPVGGVFVDAGASASSFSVASTTTSAAAPPTSDITSITAPPAPELSTTTTTTVPPLPPRKRAVPEPPVSTTVVDAPSVPATVADLSVGEVDAVLQRALSTALPSSRPSSLTPLETPAIANAINTALAAQATPQHNEASSTLPEPAPPRPSTPVQAIGQNRTPVTSPAPPPLPRRAAARDRDRPRSMIGGPGLSIPSRSTTPAPESAASATPVAAIASETSAIAEQKEPLDDLNGKTVGQEKSSESKEESKDRTSVLFDASHPDLPSSLDAKAGEHSLPLTYPESEDNNTIALSGSTGPISVPSPKPAPLTADTTNIADKAPSRKSFVGSESGTLPWEERSWKELTRLREAMFWARMGGDRTPSEDAIDEGKD